VVKVRPLLHSVYKPCNPKLLFTIHGLSETLVRDKGIKILKARKFSVRTVTVLVVLLVFVSATNTALAQYPPPTPPASIIIRETPIMVSYTEPQRAITIDITQFDPEQVVKKITLTLKEPAFTASFTIYLLAEKPREVPDPKDRVALFYFTIRAHEALLENVDSVKITFAIEKALLEERGVDEKTITLDWLLEGALQELPTKKVDEDERFLFFEAESSGLSHFAVTYIVTPFLWYITPFLWWIGVIIVIVAAAIIMAEIWINRSLRKTYVTSLKII